MLTSSTDGFIGTIRKFVVTWGLVLSAAAAAFAIYLIVDLSRNAAWSNRDSAAEIVLMATSLPAAISFLLIYLWARITRTVSDRLISMWMVSFEIIPLAAAFAYPHFLFGLLALTTAATVVICHVPLPYAHIVFNCIVFGFATYNAAAVRYSDTFTVIALPGVRIPDGSDVLIAGAGGLVLLLWCISLVAYQASRQQLQERQARYSASLTRQLLRTIRRYDTEKALTLLTEAKSSPDSDTDLISGFENLIHALEEYRPHLPSYLFLEMEAAESKDGKIIDWDISSISSGDGTAEDDQENSGSGSDRRKMATIRNEESASAGSPSRNSQLSSIVTSSDNQDASGRSDLFVESVAGMEFSGNSARKASLPAEDGAANMSPNVPTFPLIPVFGASVIQSGRRNSGSQTGQSAMSETQSRNPLVSNTMTSPNTTMGPSGRPLSGLPPHLRVRSAMTMAKSIKATAVGNGASFIGRISVAIFRFTALLDKESGIPSLERRLNNFCTQISDFATQHHATVHHLIGDTVLMTWNATHRVACPEVKASKCFVDLEAAATSCGMKSCGAIATGSSLCYYAKMGNQIMPAAHLPWRGRLYSAMDFASRYSTVIVDDKTASNITHALDIRAVERLTYFVGNNQTIIGGGDFSQSKELSGNEGEKERIAAFTAFELVGNRPEAKADEWMYQLRDLENESENETVTKAHYALVNGETEKARSLLKAIAGSPVFKAPLVQRLLSKTEETLGEHSQTQ